MVKFNDILLRCVFDLLQKTPFEMGRELNVPVSTLSRNVKSGMDCRTWILVKICNTYRLDIYKFFSTDGSFSYHDIVVGEDDFVPVEFRPDMIKGYKNMADVIRCGQLADELSRADCSISDVLSQPIKRIPYKGDGAVRYFSLLFNLLPTLLDEGRQGLGISCGHTMRMYPRAVAQGDIAVRTLVDLCNTKSINICDFFQVDGEEIINDPIVADDGKPAEFHPERLADFYGHDTGVTYNELCAKLGYTHPRMLRAMSSNSPLTANELSRVCAILEVTPAYFFEDSITHAMSASAGVVSKMISSYEKELIRKRTENNLLKSRLRHMESLLKMKGVVDGE